MRAPLALVALGLLGAASSSAQEAPPRDLCSYLVDVHDLPPERCADLDHARLGALYEEALRLAPARKAAVLEAARSAAPAELSPPINERTFRAWLSPAEARGAEGRLDRSKKEAAAELERRLRALDGLTRPGEFGAKADGEAPRPPAALEPPPSSALGELSRLLGKRTPPAQPAAPAVQTLQPPPVPAPVPAAPAPGRAAIDPRARHPQYPADRAADPCVDFFEHACGNWVKNHPLNQALTRWSRMSEVQARTDAFLRDILENAARRGDDPDPEVRMLGDFYSTCMDEAAIESKGLEALRPHLARIAAISRKAELAEQLAWLQRIGGGSPIRFESAQDLRDSSRLIGNLSVGGHLLPKSHYLAAEFAPLRAAYVRHVENILRLAGAEPPAAAADAAAVLHIETELARDALDAQELRDHRKVYNKTAAGELLRRGGAFGWDRYFSAMGWRPEGQVNVQYPAALRRLERLVEAVPLDGWKAYMRWCLLNSRLDWLPKAFDRESFEFWGKKVRGAAEYHAGHRWRQCVTITGDYFPDAVGRLYVDRHFDIRDKLLTLEIVRAVQRAMEAELRDVPWMSQATKAEALAKLRAMENRIAFPDQWPGPRAGLRIARGDIAGNLDRLREASARGEIERIGGRHDRRSWDHAAFDVGASYSAQDNLIYVPAGILQPPFFDLNGDPAENYGAIGAVIAHEVSHGFDDAGRSFDAAGNLRDWWRPEDERAYESRKACVEQRYSGFTAARDPRGQGADVKVNGRLTLGENIADNAGLMLAYRAYRAGAAGRSRPDADGRSPDQRFFLSFGRFECATQTEQSAALQVETDPHAPARARVNGSVSAMPEFRRAFNCPAGSPMDQGSACRVW